MRRAIRQGAGALAAGHCAALRLKTDPDPIDTQKARCTVWRSGSVVEKFRRGRGALRVLFLSVAQGDDERLREHHVRGHR